MAPLLKTLTHYIERLTLTRVFLLAVGFRILALIVVFFCMQNVFENIDTWRFAGSDDGYSYFLYAHTLLHEGEVVGKVMSLGFSLFLSPIIWLFKAQTLEDIMPHLVIFNGIFLYALMTVLLVRTALLVGVTRMRAIFSALLWLSYPFFFYSFFKLLAIDNAVMESFTRSRFAQLSMFQAGMTDPLSATLIFASLALALQLVLSRMRPLWWSVVGALSGYATTIRSQYALVPVFYGVYLLVCRKWKELLWLVAGGIPFAAIFALSNYLQYGGVTETGYEQVYTENYEGIELLQWQYVTRLVTYPLNYSPLLLVVMVVGLCIFGYALYLFYEREKGAALLVIGYMLAVIVPLLAIEPALRNPRYFLGVIPILIVLSVEGGYYVYLYVKRKLVS